ncbi:MAG: phosphate transport system regulatory protein PhoU [Planctomycetes bacterium]|nr:phosphate transport system regulatory protein PhoU [Planctomycetota bacterium]NBY03246.1 phosphate transport system regulatory protein PhoU [Planctomycetota bacterium]
MSKHLERDLDDLQKNILGLASLVEKALSLSITALRDRNPDIARSVIQGDMQIDKEENQINEDCLKILALHQPVAGDLRRCTAALMIITDLERMGDLAEEISERAIQLCSPPLFPIPEGLQRMADMTTIMVRQSLDAFVNLDVKQALMVVRMDDEVDRYNNQIIQEIIKLMTESSLNIQHGLSMFSAVRHIERIADHATNIAEDVVYLVEGEIVRHRVQELEE